MNHRELGKSKGEAVKDGRGVRRRQASVREANERREGKLERRRRLPTLPVAGAREKACLAPFSLLSALPGGSVFSNDTREALFTVYDALCTDPELELPEGELLGLLWVFVDHCKVSEQAVAGWCLVLLTNRSHQACQSLGTLLGAALLPLLGKGVQTSLQEPAVWIVGNVAGCCSSCRSLCSVTTPHGSLASLLCRLLQPHSQRRLPSSPILPLSLLHGQA